MSISSSARSAINAIERIVAYESVLLATLQAIIDEAPKSTPPSVIKRLRELIEGMQR